MIMNIKNELNRAVNRLQYPLKSIIRKLNIKYQYIDSDDLYQEVLLYLWQQSKTGAMQDKNDSYILQGCYYHLKNHIRKHLRSIQNQAEKNHDYRFDHQSQDIGENIKTVKTKPFGYSLDEHLYYDEFKQDLSVKERTLLQLKIRGLSNREIGKKLGISHTMVSRMRKKLMQKYRIYNSVGQK